ncbi:uncharacterized protein BDR25DRAFT_359097 [Lindgomyces ingoldianus]|uniref:Uncharacterized protein n=1 Tax=Lindgomyces ingoldianus TaxID=673940 RepID=A0ACB6QJ83_9PLEO|nr:uncharacterized protein BDR25DRAFT_359097 [Lindgomyces ingoldianus]KAF2467053.1 hypothetical protein BDR25DRAFT_359097 [Lindgomyces ingoldianus]
MNQCRRLKFRIVMNCPLGYPTVMNPLNSTQVSLTITIRARMVNQGKEYNTAPIRGWRESGKKPTVLNTENLSTPFRAFFSSTTLPTVWSSVPRLRPHRSWFERDYSSSDQITMLSYICLFHFQAFNLKGYETCSDHDLFLTLSFPPPLGLHLKRPRYFSFQN